MGISAHRAAALIAMDDLTALETWAAPLIAKLQPAQVRQLTREIARDLRRSQAQRIAAQVAPDGTPQIHLRSVRGLAGMMSDGRANFAPGGARRSAGQRGIANESHFGPVPHHGGHSLDRRFPQACRRWPPTVVGAAPVSDLVTNPHNFRLECL